MIDVELLRRETYRLIEEALAEDVGSGDVTTHWTVDAGLDARATIVSKETLVLAGCPVALHTFSQVEPLLRIRMVAADGDRLESGEVAMEVSGPAWGILIAERTALNFLGHLSGIATLTRAFVDEIEGTQARIIDTRKTTPGWRHLEKAAVRAGGGTNHRLGLYDMVLIKDNHIAAAGGISAAVERVRRENKRALTVEVEVATLEEMEEVLLLGVDRILLDNMSFEQMSQAALRCAESGEGRPELEASGNVTLETVRRVAETGVDLISVGALTHSALNADLSLRLES